MAKEDSTREANFGYTDLIVRVGPKQERFSVPRPSLKDASNLLTTADEKDLCQGKPEELANITAADFKVYVNWLCGCGLPNDMIWTSGYDNLFRVYLLSQPLQDIRFRDAVLDSIIEKYNESTDNMQYSFVPSSSATQWVYQKTEKGSFLRDLVVSMHVRRAEQKRMRGAFWSKQFPKEFLEDLIDAMLGDGDKDEKISDGEAEEFRAKQNQILDVLPPPTRKRKRAGESKGSAD